VLRGGSWHYEPWYCRAAARLYNSPGLHYDLIGFRVCCGPSIE